MSSEGPSISTFAVLGTSPRYAETGDDPTPQIGFPLVVMHEPVISGLQPEAFGRGQGDWWLCGGGLAWQVRKDFLYGCCGGDAMLTAKNVYFPVLNELVRPAYPLDWSINTGIVKKFDD